MSAAIIVSNAVEFPGPSDRFHRLIFVDANGCWIWQGRKSSTGHGRFAYDGRELAAHRFSYQLHIGNVGRKRELDHLCRNRACCNPSHLEPVSDRENTLRGIGPTAENARKTHCKRGHELPAPSARGKRECRSCARVRDVERRTTSPPHGANAGATHSIDAIDTRSTT